MTPSSLPNPELIDDEIPELDDEWFAKAKPAAEVLPPSLCKELGLRRPQRMPDKERITLRLSREVIEHFRATGEGWQARIDDALADWLKTHSNR